MSSVQAAPPAQTVLLSPSDNRTKERLAYGKRWENCMSAIRNGVENCEKLSTKFKRNCIATEEANRYTEKNDGLGGQGMKRRILAALISAALCVSSMPAVGAAAAADTPEGRKLVASYDMSHADNKLTDISGSGNDAEIVGFTEEDFAKESEDEVLNFAGNGGEYIKLPAGLIEKESFAVEATFKTDTVANSWLWCLGTKVNSWPNVTNYVFVSPAFSGNVVRAGIKDGSNEKLFNSPGSITTGTYHTVRLEFENGDMKLLVNGEERSTLSTGYSIQDILKNGTENGTCGYIGKSLYSPDPAFTGTLTQFDVYAACKDRSDEGLLKEDLDAIVLPESTSEDLVLPTEGSINGSTIVWTSSDEDILSADGKVTLPAENMPVTMTAEGTYGSKTEKRTYTVVVIGADVLLQQAADALVLEDQDQVRGNLPLEKHGTNGTTITWESSNPAVVTDSDDEDACYGGGVVTRPAAGAEPVKVMLTAIITLGGQSTEKKFEVTVQPMPADLDTDYTAGYLWTNFDASGGYEKIFFGYSEDGLNWSKLNKDANGNPQPVLVNDAEGSDLGVRDPHLIRSAEGDRYWILGTDLHAEGGGAGGSGWNQLSASQNLVVWESDDLVTWSEPRLVYAGFDHAGCVWAPEAIYDETTGDYVVYWSARDNSKAGTNDNALRVYVCRTRDFRTFSEPKVWLSEDEASGSEVNIIDTTIVKDGEKFYRFSTSDWNTVMDVSDTLATDDVFDVRQNRETSVGGNWTRLIQRSESSAKGFSGCEGLTVYQLPDGRWCAMGDRSGYTAYLTEDLASGTFTKSTSAVFADGRFRHGTVVRLSQAEQDRLLKAYGEAKEPDDPTEPKVLAEFTFDDEETGFSSEHAKAEGAAYRLDKSLDGKALYLDGSASNYLTVTDKDGGSLLAGLNEITISYEAKPDRTSTNWIMYAAPNADSQTYLSEKYLGIMESGGSTKVERYNNSGSRPAAPSASTGERWVHVDVVVSKTATTIYVNGVRQSSENSSYGLAGILGNSGILQIGKANWGSGEYYKGWIDNFRIENRALGEEEVKVLASEFVDKLPLEITEVVTGSAPDRETALEYRGTDDHTAIFTKIDEEKKEITSYVRTGTDVAKIPVTFTFTKEPQEITVNGKVFTNGSEIDLSTDATVVIKNGAQSETWILKTPVISSNPVLPGQYADPDIDYLDGKFWIFPTTDGYPSWSGTVFHAFSSTDMVKWEDEGIIMDLKNDNPGKNEKDVQIAASPWATGSAWAPTIEEKDGRYYFYYCGKFSNGQSAIGVAVADDPAGPYVDKGEALLTVAMCTSAGVSMGQAIDPSIFTDDDGTSYIMFGNGKAAIAELNDDMMSIKEGSLKQINGLTDFRESVVVTKANGKYHWTWSCDDANSPNYHVNYGVSDALFDENGKVNVTVQKKNLLSKDESQGILGSAHQSVLHVKDGTGADRYFMAYHRFYTPLDIFTSADGLGKHRETCIDEIFFDENGYMTVTPTLEGVGPVVMTPETPKAAFVDVEEGDWYEESVQYVYENGIMTGLDSTHFGPADGLPRAQFAVVLYRMEGTPEVTYKEIFPDVEDGQFYSDAVSWASSDEVQIMKGYGAGPNAGMFGTSDGVSREQMVTMLYRYAVYKGYDTSGRSDLAEFPDKGNVSEFAEEAFSWAVAKGLIIGDNGSLNPQGEVNRAQCASVIQRFMEKAAK